MVSLLTRSAYGTPETDNLNFEPVLFNQFVSICYVRPLVRGAIGVLLIKVFDWDWFLHVDTSQK